MADDTPPRPHARWAHFRLSVIGPLLASPPQAGQLKARLSELAATEWTHPLTGSPVRFGRSTVERWYYAARDAKDPVGALKRKVRSDQGRMPAVTSEVARILRQQYADHPTWSYQLHRDELAATVRLRGLELPVPSRSTVQRFLVRHGLAKQRRTKKSRKAGAREVAAAGQDREVRSFEATHVHGLWHSDFHSGSLRVLTRAGRWVHPRLLAFLDDRSRLVCHLQWYLQETAETFAHGLTQAIQKRGLPRGLMTDNGSAMVAAEVTQGLARLGVPHARTLPYSPHQNGKQEAFWGSVEGRLLAMLEGVAELTLDALNEATLAWVEREYHRREHSELGESPRARVERGPDVARPPPTTDALRVAFTAEESRRVRQSDGTISLYSTRYEIPGAYRHLKKVPVRFASWDLSRVHIAEGATGALLARIFPVDKAANADGRRRRLGPTTAATAPDAPAARAQPGCAALLDEYLAEARASGLAPPYIPLETEQDGED